MSLLQCDLLSSLSEAMTCTGILFRYRYFANFAQRLPPTPEYGGNVKQIINILGVLVLTSQCCIYKISS